MSGAGSPLTGRRARPETASDLKYESGRYEVRMTKTGAHAGTQNSAAPLSCLAVLRKARA